MHANSLDCWMKRELEKKTKNMEEGGV
jgi:hypothetical protein